MTSNFPLLSLDNHLRSQFVILESHMSSNIIPIERIKNKIYLIRDLKVMIDLDLADLYGVGTKVLNQAVKRNKDRFPKDFMFQLTSEEMENLRSQIVTAKPEAMKIRFESYAFTEQGVAMLSSVLKSKRAVMVNIQIMRTFTKLRRMILENDDLRRKLEVMEKQYDEQFKIVFDALRQLLSEPENPSTEIGFKTQSP